MRFHNGILAAHRSAEVNYKLLERAVWWPDMERTSSLQTVLSCGGEACKCLAEACWQEVSIDCEGPNREDREGYRYSITYFLLPQSCSFPRADAVVDARRCP